MRRAAIIVALLAALPARAQRTIVIDPGHGGVDPGGSGNNMDEKNIVLDVSLRFRDLLNRDTADTAGGGSWRVLVTRTDDTFVGLSARAAYANNAGADRFMCIHSNAFSDPAANGTETFAYAEGGQAAALRNLVQEEMIAAWGLRNRGNKVANFAVLRETSMPAELHELAFITNVTDARKLASATDRQSAAVAHLRAIQRHFGIAPYVPGGPPPPPPAPPDYGADFQDQSGALEMTSGEIVRAWVEYTNTGARAWNPTTTRLGTSAPRDRDSAFYDPATWIAANRPTAADQSYAHGATGRFTFTLKAPEVTAVTSYTEHFALVQEGTTWFGPSDETVSFMITVHPRSVGPGPGPDPTPPPPPSIETGGCSVVPTGAAPGWVLLLVLGVASSRRRRKR